MESSESGIGFQEYWQILKRRGLPGLAVFASVVALTTYGTLQEKAVYQAEGKLLFKKTTPGSALTDSVQAVGDDRKALGIDHGIDNWLTCISNKRDKLYH